MAQAGQAAGAPAVVFGVAPCRPRTEVIDYSTKRGYVHFKDATAKLCETLYDCEPDGFYQFMKSLKMRAKKFGWTETNGILMIPPDPATQNVVKNLLDDYGTISYEAILAKEQTYIDTDCRETQDTHMLYECIMNSLTDEGRAKLNIDDDLYTVGTFQRMSGACLLKILIRESHLDSNATSSMIRFKLSNLDEYLSEIDNDINKFHKYVKVLIDNLHARGETTHDLLANLFKAYAACSDQTFVKYMSDVQTRWEDDEALTPNQLMQKAAHKFKILKSKDLWEAPSAQDEKITALESILTDMKNKLKHFKEGKKRGNKSGRNEDSKKQKYENTKKPSWMFERPKDADLTKPREWNGAKWYYCSTETGGKCHGIYRKHRPNECRTVQPKSQKAGKGRKGKPNKKKGDNDGNMDVVVAQQAIGDPSSPDDGDVLMGGYETE